MAIIGTLFVCPHCDECLEQLGEPPNPDHPEAFPECDCGAVMVVADDELDRRVAYSRSAGSFEFRGG